MLRSATTGSRGRATRRSTALIAGLGALLVALALCVGPADGAQVRPPAVAQPTAVAPAATPARSCASFPTPGTIAPASTRLPAGLIHRYAVLGLPHRPVDALSAADVRTSLTASGLVLSRARFLGEAALGGRVYLIPAEHLLAFKLAPDRCLPAAERSLENELRPQLERQYRHWALCVVVLHSNSASPSCGAADADPEALLYAAGTPGFGLVANGVADVTVAYLNAPSRTLRVRHNFFLLDEPRQPAAPCSVEWEDATANVVKTFAGCDYAQLLQTPLDSYRSYVTSTLGTLDGEVTTMIDAIDAHDLAAAQGDWLTAHETWLDVGQDDGAYSAYGQLGRELDGTAAGLVDGTASPDFTGFHKLELDLWQNEDLGAAAVDAAQLQQVLGQIIAVPIDSALPSTDNGIASWVLRPHEILEDAIRDTLTGEDDYGSGTGIASITADVTATREFLSVLAPALGPLAPGLIPQAESELTALDSACFTSQVNGQWVAVADLPARQREQIDADAGAAVETLARVPDVLTNIGNGAPTV